jgi:hypothetical protein
MSIDILPQIKDFLTKNEHKIVLIVAFCLISAISFEFGILKGQKWQQKPLVIEKPINTPETVQNGQIEPPKASGSIQTAVSQSTKDCTFLASKNSNKYHTPTCQWAKRIKSENLVCYKSVQDAENNGKQKCSCVK